LQYKWTVLLVTTVGILMSGIDSRIVIVGLPEVAYALHASAEQAIWFTQAYVFGATIAVLMIGRTADVIGRVRIYNIGFAIFTIGSLLTGISQTADQVILFRGFQGFGSAFLMVISATLITDATPRNELGFAVGLNQIAFRAGSMAGLTLSGIILSFLDWRFLFLINIPIGIFGTVWSRGKLKEIAPLDNAAPMDWIGFGLVTTSITGLLLALTYAAYGVSSLDLVVLFFSISASAFAAFVYQEVKTKYPLLDLRLLKIPEFTGGSLAILINAVAWGALLLILSLYFQIGLDMTPLQAGILILPFEVAFLATGPLSGRLSDKYGQTYFMVSGLVIQTVALFLFSTLGIGSSYGFAVIYMVIFGAGVGIFASPNMSAVMGAVPANRRGIASALRTTAWNVGYTISLNLAIVLMSLTLPYQTVSTLISSEVPTITAANRELFVESLKSAYFWLGVINATAIVPTLFCGRVWFKSRKSEILEDKAISKGEDTNFPSSFE
jgi:EmrB/QacA subfamily drug resistance transporter